MKIVGGILENRRQDALLLPGGTKVSSMKDGYELRATSGVTLSDLPDFSFSSRRSVTTVEQVQHDIVLHVEVGFPLSTWGSYLVCMYAS